MTERLSKFQPSDGFTPDQQAPGSSNVANQVCSTLNDGTFSVASPTVTQYNANLNDSSLPQRTSFYHPDDSSPAIKQSSDDSTAHVAEGEKSLVFSNGPEDKQSRSPNVSNIPQFPNEADILSGQHTAPLPPPSVPSQAENQTAMTESEPGSSAASQNESSKNATISSMAIKKKNKPSKKIIKLDTKSKLEKSRQSARECRARKKLRYQYLEDLVCNREKAVLKLKEELFMFCKMSEQIETQTLTEADRRSLVEQTKENSKS